MLRDIFPPRPGCWFLFSSLFPPYPSTPTPGYRHHCFPVTGTGFWPEDFGRILFCFVLDLNKSKASRSEHAWMARSVNVDVASWILWNLLDWANKIILKSIILHDAMKISFPQEREHWRRSEPSRSYSGSCSRSWMLQPIRTLWLDVLGGWDCWRPHYSSAQTPVATPLHDAFFFSAQGPGVTPAFLFCSKSVAGQQHVYEQTHATHVHFHCSSFLHSNSPWHFNSWYLFKENSTSSSHQFL